jgi:hypothetical protein
LAADRIGGGINVLEKTKPVIKVYGFDDIDSIETITSVTLKRQILDKLQVNLVAFNDRFEIRCQIPMEAERSVNVILNLEIPPLHKRSRRNSPSKS